MPFSKHNKYKTLDYASSVLNVTEAKRDRAFNAINDPELFTVKFDLYINKMCLFLL